jgi:hypothetical protein
MRDVNGEITGLMIKLRYDINQMSFNYIQKQIKCPDTKGDRHVKQGFNNIPTGKEK